MADTINIILEYLHRHHFIKAEAVLRSEVTARQQSNGPLPIPMDDDVDLDVTIYLKSMQEKAAEQQGLDVPPEKRPVETEKNTTRDLEPMESQLKQALEVKEKLHSQPLEKVEEPEPLFMEFEVEELEHPIKPLPTIGSSSPPSEIQPPVPEKTLPVTKKSPARVGGLGVLQTDAEVAASSSVENVAPVSKVEQPTFVAGKSTGGKGEGEAIRPVHLEELMPSREIVDHMVIFEATRGKVDALKQRWEPKSTDKPAILREKGRAVAPKKVDGEVDRGVAQQEEAGNVDSNGPTTPDQAAGKAPPTIESKDEVRPGYSEGIGGLSAVPIKMGVTENVPLGMNCSGPKSPEWTDVPIKTFPPIKTSVSLTTGRTEEAGRDVNSAIAHPSQHGGGGDKQWYKTLSERELSWQVAPGRESDSQGAGVPMEECKKQPEVLVRGQEKPSEAVETKMALSSSNLAQEELPKLPPVRLRSNEPKTPEAPRDALSGGIRKNSEATNPVIVAGPVEATPFGLGSYLDIPVGQDITSSGDPGGHPSSYLDTPGSRRMSATARPSVSHGIVEDQSEVLSSFATAGDGQSESAVDYPDDYWDSDTYEDDDDPGYHRQPIEDEEWFLAHEIDYPSEDERSRPSTEIPRGSHHEKDYEKYDDEDRSFVEEEQSYFSGEEYYRTKGGEGGGEIQVEIDRIHTNELFGRMDGGEVDGLHSQVPNGTRLLNRGEYERQRLTVEGLTLMAGEPRWQGFDASKPTQSEGEGINKIIKERAQPDVSSFEVEDDRLGSVRFGGVGVSSDVAEFGSEMRESLPGGSSEGDLEIGEIGVRSVGQTSSSSQVANSDSGKVVEPESAGNQDDDEEEDLIMRYYNNPWASHKRRGVEREGSSGDSLHFENQENGKSGITKLGSNGDVEGHGHKDSDIGGGPGFGGFSFPSPSTSGGEMATVSRVDSGKSLWSVRDITAQVLGGEGEEYGNGVLGPDDPLASWRRKSNESSPIISPRNQALRDVALSVRSMGSANSTDGYGGGAAKDDEDGDEDDDEVEEEAEEEDLLEVDQQIREAEAVAAEDEEAAAIQEQIRRIRAEEDEFEMFDLKIVHRKNRTGFEEDKDFPVVINAVIAGRYHVTEYLGSAAFSKAIQAHDLHTGMDVCMKIIKNNKDFFDQSLDEIKLLKYINKHDPGDKHHVLRLFDYFYHREHLFIVCELLRANLYEFHKYNRESGGEVYFTMPRLQSITRQCLEALEFIHGLGLIHCDLKPENILVKSYSRCEVKVIDLGSSCFQTDHLCSYVQSRSYRAPEVILGHPYDQKIDMWSLGCILAELCSGNVLFQNDSLATLLARVVGILGPVDPDLLAKGRDTHKFFTKNHMLYERNQDSDQLEYLLPKKTSLSHRLPMGDQGFVDFVGYLLQINPSTRPSASEALKHPWLSYPYEPISS